MSGSLGRLSFDITASSTPINTLGQIRSALTGLVAPATQAQQRVGQLNAMLARSPFRTLTQTARETASALRDVQSPLASITGAVGLAGLARMVSNWGSFTNALGMSSARLQTNTAQLQSMQGAARLLGGSASDLTNSFAGFRQVMTDAAGGRNNEAVGYLSMLGISLRDARGEVNKGTAGFYQLADAIGRLRSNPELQVQLMRSFGIAESLWPVVRRGSAAMREFEAEARSFGASNEEAARKAEELVRAQRRVGLALEGVSNRVAERFAPALSRVLNLSADWIRDNRDLATGSAVVAGVLTATLIPAATRMGLAMFGIGRAGAAIAALTLPAWAAAALAGGAAVGAVAGAAGQLDQDNADRANRGEAPMSLADRLKQAARAAGVQFDPDPYRNGPVPGGLRDTLERHGWRFRDGQATPPAGAPAPGGLRATLERHGWRFRGGQAIPPADTITPGGQATPPTGPAPADPYAENQAELPWRDRMNAALRRLGMGGYAATPSPGAQSVVRLPGALPPGIGEQVASAADRAGVPRDFATAIARIEAGTGRISPKGAIGTMQLMPGTARDLGVDPYDQQQNVAGGVEYLRQLLQKFQGNTLAAGAAYNAGPNHAGVQHFANTGDRSRLPDETRMYLSRLESQGIGGQVQVRVDIGNAPPGTRATASASGGGVKVEQPRIERAMPNAVSP